MLALGPQTALLWHLLAENLRGSCPAVGQGRLLAEHSFPRATRRTSDSNRCWRWAGDIGAGVGDVAPPAEGAGVPEAVVRRVRRALGHRVIHQRELRPGGRAARDVAVLQDEAVVPGPLAYSVGSQPLIMVSRCEPQTQPFDPTAQETYVAYSTRVTLLRSPGRGKL